MVTMNVYRKVLFDLCFLMIKFVHENSISDCVLKMNGNDAKMDE